MAQFAEDRACRHAQAAEAHHAVAAGEAGVQRVQIAVDVDAGRRHFGQKHRRAGARHHRHDDGERRAFGTGGEPLEAADDVVISVGDGVCLQHRRVRAGARRRFGHAEAGADLAGRQRSQPALLLRRRRHRFEQVHVALVGGEDVQRHGAQHRVAGFLERDGAPTVRQPEATVLGADMRRQQSGTPRAADQFGTQRFLRAMRAQARVALERDHLLGDEAADLRLQCAQRLGDAEVHFSLPACCRATCVRRRPMRPAAAGRAPRPGPTWRPMTPLRV